METRRQFLKKAAVLAGAAGVSSGLVDAIKRAVAISPDEGSTFWDAEHVVILMQENRSFDHAFGTLQGVRGFNDPRAVELADGRPVWVQTNRAGDSYLPFRLDIKETNATWMGSIPHSWADQVDARNNGQYNGWLDAKRSGHEHYANVPLTMGYYTRDDIPFYYDLADAFTICDQNFCSTLTGTTPNRLHLWTGTIRPEQSADAPAMVLNSEVDYPSPASWTTFPERLEDLGVSWKIYQNELWVGVGFEGEEDPWLGNFGCNPMEYFTQYNVRLSKEHCRYLEARAEKLAAELAELHRAAEDPQLSRARSNELKAQIKEAVLKLGRAEADRNRWNREAFERLSPREKNLHEKAFCTNSGDPDYHTLSELTYQDGEETRGVLVPKGDLLHQFREDVAHGTLPTVSWVVPPERFSDHPCSAWYGAWYIAEMLDILTKNPEVWKKTIFILTYDENDGYFDHVPPFVAPHPKKPETGHVSKTIDAALEYVELEQDLKRRSAPHARESSLGLGYRVPLIIASPWSRGGCVCSQVFDHTSPLQFLEKFLTRKTGVEVRETNINEWRRTVCGDLTSAFQPASKEELKYLTFPTRDAFVEQIHRAQFKKLPENYSKLTAADIERFLQSPRDAGLLPRQEPGGRRSCPLPYELAVDGGLSSDRQSFNIRFACGDKLFGKSSAGAPFVVYEYRGNGEMRTRNYAVVPSDALEDSWRLADFVDGHYRLAVYGPNGFFREYRGDANSPLIQVSLKSASNAYSPSGDIEVHLTNHDPEKSYEIEVADLTYESGSQRLKLAAGQSASCVVNSTRSFGWYDVGLWEDSVERFRNRYAGRVETGHMSFTDPAMA